ncbi:MAG: hypothetical protein QF357_10095 [Dehalococcoidia bacterium]|mgnify:FL=1|nr:hypothetical protein [Dehalococcoidia bacterium]
MDKLPGNPLPTEETVTADWLIKQLGAELIRQDPVLGREFVPLRRMSQIAGRPGGSTKVFFGVRCECRTAAVVSFEAAMGKTRSQVLEALPQSGRKLIEQRHAFVRMPCTAHDRLRVDNFERSS